MSFKSGIVKMAIKCTPNGMVMWVANMILKEIAVMSDFSLDLDARKAYVQVTLVGEPDPIEVWLDGFAVIDDTTDKRFILQQAQSNKPWLNAIMAKIVGKPWKIPAIPQLAPYMDLVAELLKAENPVQEEIESLESEHQNVDEPESEG